MKIAVISDIHGNVPALGAVLEDIQRWRPDQLIVNGDLVNRGPYSLQCLRMIQAAFPSARYLTGNHESYVLNMVDNPTPADDPSYDLSRFAAWTAAQLGEEVVAELRTWGDHIDMEELDGGSLHVTHGSRVGNRDGIRADTPLDDLPAKLGDPRDLFIASHTHRPMVRPYNDSLVVNVGSVGQPLDGDPRAAYGRFSFAGGAWRADIARIEYDKQRAEQDFHDSGFLAECGPMAAMIHLELRSSRMHVGPWMRHYLPLVKAGEISVAQGVRDYLSRL